jgi:Na+/melibiose symporter-like transporter
VHIIITDAGGWVEKWTQKVLSWFSQREVKTPLAFYFRLVGAIVVVVLTALYFSPPEQRLEIFFIAMLCFAGLAIIVALFAAFNVKNLVYGEAGHRAEMRFKFGTEKREFDQAEVATMPQIENPIALPGKDNPDALDRGTSK